MNHTPRRPLRLEGLRAFESVARWLSFGAAARALHFSQPAVSRQIQAREAELGSALFSRGTRRVELSDAGKARQQVVLPPLDRLDRMLRDIRQRGEGRQVSLSTFASFATLRRLPRLADFQAAHQEIDIGNSADDRLLPPADDPGQDLLLRFGAPGIAPPHAQGLFGEVLTPGVRPSLLARGEPVEPFGTALRRPSHLGDWRCPP